MSTPKWLARALVVDYEEFLPLRAEERRFGWLKPEFAALLARFPGVFICEPQRVSLAPALATPAARTAAVAKVLDVLRAEGAFPGWRDECCEVYAEASGEPLFRIERGAVKHFGIRSRAAHLNGVVDTGHGLAMWIARRSRDKATDPGKLDNLVGGGIAAEHDAWQTLVKEAREEASIPFFLMQDARPRDTLTFDYLASDGLDANEVEAFDLMLPRAFKPRNEDGEVEGFELLPFAEVRERLEVPQLFSIDAALVAWTCLQRWEVGDI